jgi:hypothetical protein
MWAGLPNGRQRLYAGPSCSNRARRSDEAARFPWTKTCVMQIHQPVAAETIGRSKPVQQNHVELFDPSQPWLAGRKQGFGAVIGCL